MNTVPKLAIRAFAVSDTFFAGRRRRTFSVLVTTHTRNSSISNHPGHHCGVCTCAIVAAILAFHAPTNTHAQVLPPDANVAGMSQAEWGVLGTKWAFENPAGRIVLVAVNTGATGLCTQRITTG